MPQFKLEIAYSQVAVFNSGLAQPFNNWTEGHFNQGFVWRPQSVSFRTAARTGKGTVSLDRVTSPQMIDDAVVAISVPFELAETSLEVASIFEGEVIAFEPGDYELIFQTGRDGTMPWVNLQFVPRKIETATILKGGDLLKVAEPLLMAAEPA